MIELTTCALQNSPDINVKYQNYICCTRFDRDAENTLTSFSEPNYMQRQDCIFTVLCHSNLELNHAIFCGHAQPRLDNSV
jgi:hypothetical protein